ncbi:MAG: DNA repair protein RecO C-terminal domain-containing protein, partial [Oscillospiraceae bacterium]|nr:DNA repair protein RecO C-terminal domain-containing protein [Oscillospiraceae bacterium]
SRLSVSEWQVKAAYELRCACIAGYTPDLSACHVCGNTAADRFDISAGRLECRYCRSSESDGLRMPLSPGMLDAMRYIVSCDPKRLLCFQTGSEAMDRLAQLTETYLTRQLERGFSTRDFYKSLLIE